MQNRRNDTKNNIKRKREYRKEIELDEFLMGDDGVFDDEDDDTVTDDTLEFLCLDDEAIEAYQRGQNRKKASGKRTAGRYADGTYEEETYYAGDGDGDYEDGAYEEDEDYADEVYAEDGDYEDEDYDGDEDSQDVVYEDYEDEDYDGDEDYEDEDYDGDEGYEDEDYDGDEDYEDEDYEDEDYEDEDYEDEDYEYDYDDDDGIIVRFRRFVADMGTLDMVVALLGVVVLAGVIVTGVLYANARTVEKQVAAFATVGEELEGISVIGESGLVAVAESARLGSMIEPEEEPEQEEQQDTEKPEQNKEIEVVLNLTSIKSDLKIKFVNKATGKLIGGLPFEVEVTNGNKNFGLMDEDKDGIIYQTGIDAGTYRVTVKPFAGDKYADYKLPSSDSSVKVTDTIAYKKVDVADEVKAESEVNAAAEDKTVQNTVVESTLTDTVEWVESTKTPVGEGTASYEEVSKKNIPDPWTVSGAYRKLVEEGDGAEGEDPANIAVAISSASLSLDKGEKASLSVSVTGTSLRYVVEWGSSDTNVATVSDGNVTGVGVGSATVTARVAIGSMIQEVTCSVSVSEPEKPDNTEKPDDTDKPEKPDDSNSDNQGSEGTVYTKISISGDKEVAVGRTITLSAKTEPKGGKVKWESADESIAKIDGKGVVTGVAEGTVTIWAVCENSDTADVDASCEIKVKKASEGVVYTKVSISGDKEVSVGKKVTLTAKTEPEGGKVKWKSDNDKIAKVDDNGVVTGVAEGTAKITAVCENKDADNVQAEYEIKVKKAQNVDGNAKLKDKDGNQMYYKKDGEYKEAVYDDYSKYDVFYKKSTTVSEYRYTGWQTLDGHVYFFDKNGNYVTGEQVIQGAKYKFGSDGKLASSSGTMGIDVSKHNGGIDWNAVKNSGVSYVIIRCGYRGYSTGALIEDPKFRSNIKGAKSAGLKVGVYVYSQAVNEVEAVEEASMAVSLAGGYGLDYPIFIDVEGSGGRGDGVSKDMRTAVCKAFCATVQNSGYSAGIYANKTWFTEKINTGSLTGYKIWLAQYASAPTYTATRYDMWQYSSRGRVSGIKGDVDMNISYMHY